jgi:hypothetical protein
MEHVSLFAFNISGYNIAYIPLQTEQWLRYEYCATNRNVAGSILDGVIGIVLLI